MAVSAVLGIAGLGLAAYGAIHKAQQEKKAAQNLANRPTYKPLPEDDSELRIAESMANNGMSGNARQALQNNTDRTLATTTNAALMGGADQNAIAGIVDRSQNSYNQNALYEDQARMQNLRQLMQTYSRYNAQRQGNADKQFQVNQYAPWADKQQMFAQNIAGAQQTMNSGINMFGSAASGYLSGMGGNSSAASNSSGNGMGSMIGNEGVSGAVSGFGGASSGGGYASPGATGSDNFTNWGNGESGKWNMGGYMPVYQ